MYLRAGGTYYRGTEQCARRAPFLILFSWNGFKALDEVRAECAECTRLARDRETAISRHDEQSWRAIDWPYHCADHGGIKAGAPEVTTYPNGKPRLWALVRSVALHQCGNFMMGSATVFGTQISISGAYGADGLPRDYQDVPPAYRDRLVEVPEEIAAAYWAGGGHNSAGNEAPTLRSWALSTFEVGDLRASWR